MKNTIITKATILSVFLIFLTSCGGDNGRYVYCPGDRILDTKTGIVHQVDWSRGKILSLDIEKRTYGEGPITKR